MSRLLALAVAGWVAARCAGGEAPPPRPSGRDPREHIGEILRRPLYQRWRRRQERGKVAQESELMRSIRETVERWRKAVARKLAELLAKLRPLAPEVPRPGGLPAFVGALKVLGYVVVGILVVFLAFLAYRLIREGQLGRRHARVLSREQVREALEQGEALALGGPQWLAEAERLAREGNFRAVYRALYLALLSGLHERGKIDFRRSRTNWTYVRRYRGPEDERGVFADLTSLFDRVWYGFKPAQDRSVDALRGQVEGLLATEVPRG